MTCPHLEETSSLFDGRAIDRAHADSCDECRAFLADAAQLRDALSEVTFAAPRRRIAPILVPIALMLCIVVGFLLGQRRTWLQLAPPGGGRAEVFEGLDGGGRAVIAVKDAR